MQDDVARDLVDQSERLQRTHPQLFTPPPSDGPKDHKKEIFPLDDPRNDELPKFLDQQAAVGWQLITGFPVALPSMIPGQVKPAFYGLFRKVAKVEGQ